MNHRLLLAAILLVASFLRLYRFTAVPPGLYHDEAMNGCNALEALETGRFQPFYPENNGREGLYINVAAGAIRVFGNTAWALRLPAAIFGILTVWAVYLLTAELFSPRAGLFSAFFIATSFWHIDLSRLGLRAIAAPCLLAWSLWFLSAGIRRKRVAWIAAAGAVYGLGFYTYIAWRATPLLLIAFWSKRRAFAPFAVAAVIIAAPLAFWFVQHPGMSTGHAAQLSVLRAPNPAWHVVLNTWRTGRMFFTRGDINWRHNVAWRAELYWPVAILFLLGLAVRARSILPLWLLVGALPVIFSNEGVPHALRGILMIPPAMMLAGVGADRLYCWLPRKLANPAVTAVALLLWWEAYDTYFHRWASNPNVAAAFEADATAVAAQINALPKTAPKYVVIPQRGSPLAWTVMYLTRSYTARQQTAANIHYVTAAPAEGSVFRLTQEY